MKPSQLTHERPEHIVLPRDRWRTLTSGFFRDIRFAFRLVRRNLGFTVVTVLTLALGIGSTSAIFALIHGVLLTPPPYREPDKLVLITPAKTTGEAYDVGPTTEQWTQWREQARSFSAMAGYNYNFEFLIQKDASESASGLEVTHDYFSVLSIKPLLGRVFSKSDEPSRIEPQTHIILGYNFWKRHFNGDTNILGQKITISRHPQPLTVIGIVPNVRSLPSIGETATPGYDIDKPVDYWLPIAPDMSSPYSGSRNGHWSIVARLAEGKNLWEAQAEIKTIAARQAQENPRYKNITASLHPLTNVLNSEGKQVLLPLFGAVVLIFLIACSNVVGLMLARGVQRQTEIAIRCALGVKRIQLFRQVLIESTLLAGLAGVLGIGLAFGTIRLVKAFAGAAIPRLDAVALGGPTLAFCCGATILAAMLAGLIPAMRASRLNPMQLIKGAGSSNSVGGSERRLLTSVAILQTALTMALLIGAGLLIRTVHNLAKVRSGFQTQNILTMVVTMPQQGNLFGFHNDAVQRVSALPGVLHAAFVWGLPLTGTGYHQDIPLSGRANDNSPENRVSVSWRLITPDYFHVMGIKVAEGRSFALNDDFLKWKVDEKPVEGEPPFVAIINEAFAQKCFPNTLALGKTIHNVAPYPDRPKEIVGIIPNVRSHSLNREAEPEIYYPLAQYLAFTKHFVVRTKSDPSLMAPAIIRELRALVPALAIEEVKPMDAIQSESVQSYVFIMRLLVVFSCVGTALALVGIYGLIALSVNTRKQEIAIRVALGAQQRTILLMVLREGFILITLGLAVGTIITLASARILKGFLFGVGSTDAITFIQVALLLIATGSISCYLPALRAARIDPNKVLRTQ